MSDCLSKNKKKLILVLWSWPEEVPQRSWSSALTIKTYDPWSSGPDIKEWLLLKKKCILVLWSCPEWVPDNQSIWDPPRIRKSEYLSSGSVMKEFCLSKRLYTVVWLLCWPLVLWSLKKMWLEEILQIWIHSGWVSLSTCRNVKTLRAYNRAPYSNVNKRLSPTRWTTL